MLRAIIWDVDGLIVDSEPVHYRAFAEIARRLDVNLTWDQYVETYIGYDDRDVFRLLRGIGGKADPARLVFDAPAGQAINVSPIDLGDRFRIIVNEVDAVVPEHDLPKLPVARVLWVPRPTLKIGAAAWILAGGAHHTVYSQQVDTRHIEIFAEMADTELVVIDANTALRSFKAELRRL